MSTKTSSTAKTIVIDARAWWWALPKIERGQG